MAGNSILVTGATGFIGRNLVNSLANDYTDKLAVVTRDTEKSKSMFGKDVVHLAFHDALFKEQVSNFSPNVVIHLAAYSTSKDDIGSIKKLVDANIVFLSVLLEALKEVAVELFINTGTFSEFYFNDGEFSPVYYYAATKTASRSLVKYHSNLTDMKFCTVVPYTVYGGINPNKKALDLVFDSLSEVVSMTPGHQVSDFIHVDDVISFYLKVLERRDLVDCGDDYYLGSGKGVTLREIASLIEKISGSKTNIQWGELKYRPLDMMHAIAPIYRLERKFGWTPKISIEKGLSDAWDERSKL